MEKRPSLTVAAYIAAAPLRQRKALRELRAAIKRGAPKVTEHIRYGIPMFGLRDKYLLYIGQFKNHVSVYPVTRAMAQKYGAAIKPYVHGRGTLRFSLDEKIPTALVEKLAKVRAREVASATPR